MEEIWRDIPGYEGLYKVSNMGRIASYGRFSRSRNRIYRPRIMSAPVGSSSYKSLGLKDAAENRKHFMLHRLVAIAFIPNPKNKPCVNHINGDKLDNRIENLEWVSSSENSKHAFVTGLHSHLGERNNRCRLTETDVLHIKTLLETGGTRVCDIAARYGVAWATVNSIKSGQNWKHI